MSAVSGMSYQLEVNPKRLRAVPKAALIIWLILGLICILLLRELYYTPEWMLQNAKEIPVAVTDPVAQENTRISRFLFSHETTLSWTTDEETYYIIYPGFSYSEYSQTLEEGLRTSAHESLTAMISPRVSLRDRFLHRRWVLDLRSGQTVFFDRATAQAYMTADYSALCILTVSLCLLQLLGGFAIALLYRVVKLRKRSGKNKNH